MSKFEQKDIQDDEIRIIGGPEGGTAERGRMPRRVWWIIGTVICAAAALAFIIPHMQKPADEDIQFYFEPVRAVLADTTAFRESAGASAEAYTEVIDTTVNDIALRVYIPRHATMSLHVGPIDQSDSSIVFAAQAADVRADNGGIVGAFVLKGRQLSKGLSKKGFVAMVDGKVTVGVAENSPLFEAAIERDGYFFRQYPLVADGQLIENEPKGKSIRRGICERGGEILVIESRSRESFHDFSQALVDIGVSQAVYLVGSSAALGWARDADGAIHGLGDQPLLTSRTLPANVSFIVWR